MLSESQPHDSLKHYPVLVRPEPSGQFSAQAIGLPEIHATAGTADEALAQVQQQLVRWAAYVVWVPISPQTSSIPPSAGHAKDDPNFDIYLEEIERFRREADARECSNSSSTPTT